MTEETVLPKALIHKFSNQITDLCHARHAKERSLQLEMQASHLHEVLC